MENPCLPPRRLGCQRARRAPGSTQRLFVGWFPTPSLLVLLLTKIRGRLALFFVMGSPGFKEARSLRTTTTVKWFPHSSPLSTSRDVILLQGPEDGVFLYSTLVKVRKTYECPQSGIFLVVPTPPVFLQAHGDGFLPHRFDLVFEVHYPLHTPTELGLFFFQRLPRFVLPRQITINPFLPLLTPFVVRFEVSKDVEALVLSFPLPERV